LLSSLQFFVTPMITSQFGMLVLLLLVVNAFLVSSRSVTWGKSINVATGATAPDFTSPSYWSTGGASSLSWMGVYLSGSDLIATWTPSTGTASTATISKTSGTGATLVQQGGLLYAFWVSGTQVQYASFNFAGTKPAWSSFTPVTNIGACKARNLGAVMDYFSSINDIIMYEDSQCSGSLYWSTFNGNIVSEQGTLGLITTGGPGLSGYIGGKEFAFHQGLNFGGFIAYNSWDNANWSATSTTAVQLVSHPTATMITVNLDSLVAVAYQRGGNGYLALFDGNSFSDIDLPTPAKSISGKAGVGVAFNHGTASSVRLSWIDSTGKFWYADGNVSD
jgi:hypothetical protein